MENEEDKTVFIEDPKQELGREQTATEGEWVLTEPLSHIQSEIQLQSDNEDSDMNLLCDDKP